MVNLDKKGVIILSTYRSGGTQLLSILSHLCSDKGIDFENLGEVDCDMSSLTIKKDAIDALLFNPSDKFKIYLLNNPIVIHALEANRLFPRLLEQYEIIHLSRQDREKCLLSLALWERFIHAGLFDSSDLWTKENMLKFHNELLEKPIPFTEITLGGQDTIYSNKGSIETLNTKLMQYLCNINLNVKIANDNRLLKVYYEEYETDANAIIQKYFLNTSERCRNAIKNSYREKIPYISSRYRDYYDYTTKKALDDWNL